MERRTLLRTGGVLAAGAILPRRAIASWARMAGAVAPALDEAQLTLVGAIADTLIPRTSTPGATDVGVPGYVSVVVGRSFTPRERAAFLSGLATVEVYLRDGQGRSFVDLAPAARSARIADIEDQGVMYRAICKVLRHGEPRRTYWRLKELIVHGYFTSEIVASQVLREAMSPGKFDGDAPIAHA